MKQPSPTFEVDGKTKVGGGVRADAKTIFDEVDDLIVKSLQAAPEANLTLTASRKGDVIHAHAVADRITGDWKTLQLGIALVENTIRYSGENGIRMHSMVVRSLSEFPLDRNVGDFEQTFDTAHIGANLSSYLDEYEKSNDRFGPITFLQKMSSIDPANLSIVAFVQDVETKHVLQAAFTSTGRDL